MKLFKKIIVQAKAIFSEAPSYEGNMSREDYAIHYLAVAFILLVPFLGINLVSLALPTDASKYLYLLMIPIGYKCYQANFAAQSRRFNDIKAPGNNIALIAGSLFCIGVLAVLLITNQNFQNIGMGIIIFVMIAMFCLWLYLCLKSFLVAGKK